MCRFDDHHPLDSPSALAGFDTPAIISFTTQNCCNMARVQFRVLRVNGWKNGETGEFGVFVTGSYRTNGGTRILGGRTTGAPHLAKMALTDVTPDDLPLEEGTVTTMETDECEITFRDEEYQNRVTRIHWITPLSADAFPDLDAEDEDEDEDEEEEVVVPAPKAAAKPANKTGKGKK